MKTRQTQRRLLIRQLWRAALHPDELQARRVRGCVHACARGRAFNAQLVLANFAALSRLRVSNLSRGGRIDVQRGIADPSSASDYERSEDAGLHYQPGNR